MESTKSLPQLLYREYSISRDKIDKENRTVELSFSSEMPVDRYFGFEILDHSVESVRLDRLNSGGQLLFNHDPDDYRGVIEYAKIGSDRRGIALVRFSRSLRAEEIFQDVQDGIIRNVSVGYQIHEMVLESEENDVATYRVTDWEPIEVSLVTIPADTSVGVGRSSNQTFKSLIGGAQCISSDQSSLTKMQETVVQALAPLIPLK